VSRQTNHACSVLICEACKHVLLFVPVLSLGTLFAVETISWRNS
jgi:hypothetical protein